MRKSLSLVLMKNILSVVTAVIIMITLLLVVAIRDDIKGLLENETNNTIQIIDQQIYNYFDYPIHEITAIREHYESPLLSIEQVSNFYNTYELQLHSFQHLDLVSFDGVILSVIGEEDGRIGFDYSYNPAYLEISQSLDDYVIGDIQVNSRTNEPTLTIATAFDQGYIIGYLNLDLLSQIFEEVALDKGYIAIVDSRGNYVSHTNGQLVKEHGVDPFFHQIEDREILSGDQVTYLDGDYIIRSKDVGIAQLKIIFYQDVDEYRRAIGSIVILGIVTVVVFLPLMTYLILRITKKVDSSFRDLSYMTEKISQGDYTQGDIKGSYAEFDDLLKAFMRMSEEVHGREKEITDLTSALETNYFETVVLLAKAIEAKDTYTGNHCERVTEYAMLLGSELVLKADDMRELRIGSALHDIGKISIPENILNKSERLTREEFELIKNHSSNGYDIIKGVSKMKGAKEIILYHHEKYDGTGYPIGLVGKDIPILARITMIADAYDAMISERPYRQGFMTEREALEEIEKCAGTQFDPELALIFVRAMKKRSLS